MRTRTTAVLSLVLGAVLVAGCTGSSTGHPAAEPSAQPSASSTDPVVSPPLPTYSPVAHFVPDADALAARREHPNFGYLTVLRDQDPVTLSFDKALFLGGNEADKAAFEHGDETPVNDDFYIVNDSKKLRTVTLARAVRVTTSITMNAFLRGSGDGPQPRRASVGDLVRFLRQPSARSTGFNLAFDSAGLVVRVEEQYQP